MLKIKYATDIYAVKYIHKNISDLTLPLRFKK